MVPILPNNSSKKLRVRPRVGVLSSVDPTGDKTPTLGRTRSFFEELFGNIGTISQPGLPGAGRQQ